MKTRKRAKTPAQICIKKRAEKPMKQIDATTNRDVQNHIDRMPTHDRNQDIDMSNTLNVNPRELEVMEEPQNFPVGGEVVYLGSNHRARSSRSYRCRGPTRCKYLLDHIEINLNMRGQPDKPNSKAFSSYLGVVAREVGPITVSNWHKMPKNIKETMWTMVKQKFIIPEHTRKLTLKMIGKDWREYKGRLRKHFYDIYDNDEERIANCPAHIKLEDWKAFVANVSKPDYMLKRKKMKETRKQHIIPTTCSRKGYARLEHEMKLKSEDPSSISRADVWIKAHTKKSGEAVNEIAEKKIEEMKDKSSSTPCGSDDVLSQVLGPDPKGRARGVGFGISPTILFGGSQILSIVNQLRGEVNFLQDKLSNFEKMFAVRLEAEQSQSVQRTCQEVSGNDRAPMQREKTPLSQRMSKSAARVKCKLFRLVPDDIVAHGYWCTDDPEAVVHHVPLGPGMSKVFIEYVEEGDAKLVRKSNGMQTINDAVGTFVAWPTSSLIKN